MQRRSISSGCDTGAREGSTDERRFEKGDVRHGPDSWEDRDRVVEGAHEGPRRLASGSGMARSYPSTVLTWAWPGHACRNRRGRNQLLPRPAGGSRDQRDEVRPRPGGGMMADGAQRTAACTAAITRASGRASDASTIVVQSKGARRHSGRPRTTMCTGFDQILSGIHPNIAGSTGKINKLKN